MYPPITDNYPGDKVQTVFLILSYFVVLCETARWSGTSKDTVWLHNDYSVQTPCSVEIDEGV